jgi:hypothetical protein
VFLRSRSKLTGDEDDDDDDDEDDDNDCGYRLD